MRTCKTKIGKKDYVNCTNETINVVNQKKEII